MVTNKKQTQEDIDRLYEYTGRGFTANDDENFLRSPSGRPSQISIGGELITDPNSEDYKNMKAATEIYDSQAANKLKKTGAAGGTAGNGGQTAGSTVPQNTQNATQNQNGTSVSNGNINTRKYDGTDGNGNITVGPQNANLNYYQYGDDSNPNQQGQKGGMNAKYTGEGVSNSYIEYNPDITLADLDPNYLYGDAARQQNRKEAGYIARRNDNIASALYNEGKVSREDVANFLSQQNEWMNSTEADRLNTIESVWKRLGQIKPEEYQPDLSKAEDIVKDTSGKIYGKTTAEEGNPKQGIDTLADDNSVFKKMQEKQVKDVQDFVSQDYRNIATCVVEGTPYWSEQTWRDAQKYYPDFISLVNEEVKRQRTQNAVNNISNGNTDYVTSEMDTKKNSISSSVESMASQYSNSTRETDSIKKDIESSIATNQTASEASDTMEKIEQEAAILKNRLKNLREEANSKFKGDAPDYLVNAYMNNKAQEINNQLSILEDRYNAAYQRYTTQLNEKWKEKQYSLEEDKLNLQRQQQSFNQWYQKQTLEQSKNNYVTDDSGNVWKLNINDDGTVYYQKIEKIEEHTDSGMKGAGLRNNNPGNIKDDDFGNVVGHDSKGFAIFATPEDGFDALVEKIKYNQTNPNSRYYGTTIREYFRIYAPSSDGNNPDAYANSVAKQLGVSVDTPIKDLDPVKFAAVIAKHDSGYNYDTYGQFRKNTTDSTSNSTWDTFSDMDYKQFEAYLNPETDDKDKEVIAAQYGFKDDLAGMTRFANQALSNKESKKNFDINTIEVPDDVYVIEDEEKKMSRRADPNSEEGKKLAQQYRINKAIEMGYDLGGDTEINSNVPMTTVTLKSGESYEMPTSYFRFLWGPIPTRQKDSDQDKRDLLEQISDIYKKGYNVMDAMLLFNGIDLTDSYADKARTLFGYLMGAGKPIEEGLTSAIAFNLKNGNDGLAISAVENFVLPDKQKEDIIMITSLAEKISEFFEKVNDNEYSKYFGPLTAPINTEIGRWKGNPEATKAYSDLGNIYADIRQQLMGSAVTENEAEIYDPIFAKSEESLSTIMQKLKSTLQNNLSRYNSIRGQYGLPRLNLQDEDLIDLVLYQDARAKLYDGDNNY